jgi:acetoin utilization deacetylase AcuC-like enzyme
MSGICIPGGPMRVIYSDQHLTHNPPHQFNTDHLGDYSESPDRATSIRKALEASANYAFEEPDVFDVDTLHTVHDPDYVTFLRGIWPAWLKCGKTSPLIPYTFAHRHTTHRPADIVNQAGYYCFDPQTPIVAGTFDAAWASARSALTATDLVRKGERAVYALCRPPGHHAAGDLYGGYCYLNNTALAARRTGTRTAILDIDYHHGNGTQTIFYPDPDVFTVSIHADPNREYPFYSGAESELGTGPGSGANLNIPLPAGVDDDAYLAALDRALQEIDRFDPDFLLVSAGFDTYIEDPLGDFCLTLDGFNTIGRRIEALGRPTVVLQEGGYHLEHLGRCARQFLDAFV